MTDASFVYYEWDIETTDEFGDIEDHEFSDKLKGSGFTLDRIREERTLLVLQRTDENERVWAYCSFDDAGKLVLASCWNNGIHDLGDMPNWAVPKKFHNELAIWQRSIK